MRLLPLTSDSRSIDPQSTTALPIAKYLRLSWMRASQDVQNDRPASPSFVKRASFNVKRCCRIGRPRCRLTNNVPRLTGLSEPRTKLAAIFNILLRRQPWDLYDRPDLDGPLAGHGILGGNADRLVEILGVDEEIAAQLFACLRERTVGHKPLSLPQPNAGRHGCGTQRVGSHVLPSRVKVMRKLRRFSVTVLSLRFSQPIFVTIDQQHVFHMDASCNSSFV